MATTKDGIIGIGFDYQKALNDAVTDINKKLNLDGKNKNSFKVHVNFDVDDNGFKDLLKSYKAELQTLSKLMATVTPKTNGQEELKRLTTLTNKYKDAVSTLNKLSAKNIKSGVDSSKDVDYSRQVQIVEDLRKNVDTAFLSVKKLGDEGSISAEKLADALEAINQAQLGSVQSSQSMNAALRKTQTEIDALREKAKEYSNTFELFDSDENAGSTKYVEMYKDLGQKLADFKALIPADGIEFISDDQRQKITALKKDIEAIVSKLQSGKYDARNKNGTLISATNVDQAEQYLRSIKGIDQESIKILKNGQKITGVSGNIAGQNKSILLTLEETTGQYRMQETVISRNLNFLQKIGKTLSDSFGYMASYFSGYMVANKVFSELQNGIQVVRDMDTALTEMRKVSSESVDSLRQLQSASFDMADEVGTTAKSLDDSIATWMRLGEATDEAVQSAKDSNILLNVSEFETIDEATDSLVSMSQAYKDLDKIEIIDKLNNIGNNFSISTDGLATALKDSASALTTAYNDIDEAVALITAGKRIARIYRNVYQRLYLIAGNALELCTTIIGKPYYEGLTTQRLAVLAAKYPNVPRIPCGT